MTARETRAGRADTSHLVRPDTLLGLGFVALWSTGFVGAKYGLPWAGPFDFLAIRFAVVAVLLLAVSLVWRAPWPADRRAWAHIAVAGLLLHGVYLGGVFAGIDAGVPAGITALIVGTQPVLTAFAVGPLLGERLRPHQWAGFALGFVGLVLVVGEQLALPAAGRAGGIAAIVLALLGITAGTLYQKRFCPALDLRSGAAIQYAAAALAMIPVALVFDDQPLQWTPEFVFALAWLSVVLSLGAISLLFLLIRRGAASRVASLFYLVPPTAAAYAWLLFGETLGPAALAGMATIVVGVALVNRS
ncbi:MAG: DMT family transporter [Halofilum sp. (in: g-proteobacteria)]|nr:DMT family transporter [Halofilum sp. (in: g-proteobacteria)]